MDFDAERLAIVKDGMGNVLLSTITRESIEGFQARRKLDGVRNRTINMDVGALRKMLKRYGHWRRLDDHISMLSEWTCRRSVYVGLVLGRVHSSL